MMEAEYDSTQSSYLEEQCILVDMEDEVVGHADKRTCHLSENVAKGLLHRAFSVFLFNSEGKLLLQQRAAEKITFPSCWTNTCCSHPLHTKEEMQTEDHIGVKRAAVRKLQHELGIKQHTIDTQDLHFVTRIYYKALQNDEVWAEHEIDYVLFMQKYVDLELNLNEVQDTRYVDKQELRDLLEMAKANAKDQNGRPVTISPWFGLMCEKFFFDWWDKMDIIVKKNGLEDKEFASNIHNLGSVRA